MKTKLVLTIFLVIVLVSSFGRATDVAFADTPCDSAYVTQSGNVINVQPNGVDDTENVQCAFDMAVATGPDVNVQLGKGSFYTAQVVVNNFRGKFSGAGSNYTNITNLPNLYVNTDEVFFQYAPSVDNPWPSLFAFVDGNFTVSDLTIHITGKNPTTGWYLFGYRYEELCHAIMIVGKHADVRIERVSIEGEPTSDTAFGYNVLNGVMFAGSIGVLPPPLSGSFYVHNSTFRNMASGTPVGGLNNANIVINKNTFQDVFFGMDGGDFTSSQLEFSQNSVNAVVGIDLYNIFIGENVESKFLIKNNLFRGEIGPVLEQTFGNGNECLFLGNNIQNVADIGIFLGSEINGCTIVGGGSKTNVLDLGTGNVLLGVNNMGTGVGPEIRTLLKMMK